MSTSSLTERTKVLMTNWPVPGLSETDKPFLQVGGLTFVRWDGIRIEKATDELGGALVTFCWRGHDVAVMRVEEWQEGMSLMISGVEGRTMVNAAA